MATPPPLFSLPFLPLPPLSSFTSSSHFPNHQPHPHPSIRSPSAFLSPRPYPPWTPSYPSTYQRDHLDPLQQQSTPMLVCFLSHWSFDTRNNLSPQHFYLFEAHAQMQVTNLSLVSTFKYIMRSFTVFTSILLSIHLSEISNQTPALPSLQPCQKNLVDLAPDPVHHVSFTQHTSIFLLCNVSTTSADLPDIVPMFQVANPVVDRGVGDWGSCPGHQGRGAPKRGEQK